jgi:hypothetical protein
VFSGFFLFFLVGISTRTRASDKTVFLEKPIGTFDAALMSVEPSTHEYELLVMLVRNQHPIVDGPTLINAAGIQPKLLHTIRVGDTVSIPVVFDQVDFTKCNEFLVKFVDLHTYFNSVGIEWLIKGYLAVHKGLARGVVEDIDNWFRVNSANDINNRDQKIRRFEEQVNQASADGRENVNVLFYWTTDILDAWKPGTSYCIPQQKLPKQDKLAYLYVWVVCTGGFFHQMCLSVMACTQRYGYAALHPMRKGFRANIYQMNEYDYVIP